MVGKKNYGLELFFCKKNPKTYFIINLVPRAFHRGDRESPGNEFDCIMGLCK